MTTYYDIDSMPNEYDKENQYLRLDRIWFDGTNGVMSAYEFLNSIIKQDGEVSFSRPVAMYDEFYTSVNIHLPASVRNRLEQTVQDLAVIATALRNKQIDFGYTRPTTQGETK